MIVFYIENQRKTNEKHKLKTHEKKFHDFFYDKDEIGWC